METLTPPPIQNAIAEQPGLLTPRPWSRYFQAVRDQVMALVTWQGSLLATTPPPDVGPVSVTGTAETAARGDHTHGAGASGGYTDEQAQDAVGTILTEGPTVEWLYNDAVPSIQAQVKTQGSMQYDTNGIRLSGDAITPGNTMLYGTDGAGTKGWYAQPAPFTLGPTLSTIEALTGTLDTMLYFTGTDTAALTALTPFARTLLDDTTQAAMRGTLALTPGTDVQAQDAELQAIAGLVSAADRLPYFTGLGTATLATFTTAGRNLVDDADITAQRTTLGLGTLATVNSPVPVANGGTAATDAATARTNLGLGTMATQNANAVAITGGTATALTTLRLGLGTSPGPAHVQAVWYPKASTYGLLFVPTDTDTGAATAINFLNTAGTSVGYITTNASSTTYSTSSDGRLKEAVEALPAPLAIIEALRPVQFRWKADGSVGHGLIAQEVQQVVPGVVSGTEDGPTPLGIDYAKLVPFLVGAIQDLAARVVHLEGGSIG